MRRWKEHEEKIEIEEKKKPKPKTKIGIPTLWRMRNVHSFHHLKFVQVLQYKLQHGFLNGKPQHLNNTIAGIQRKNCAS